MKDIEELALIVERQTILIDDLINRLVDAEERIEYLQKIALPEVKETASIAYTESEKAIDLANKSLYYIPKTAEQVEEIIYNKVSKSIGGKISDIVTARMDEFKWQLAKSISD